MPSHYNDKDDDDPKQLRRKSAVRRFRNTLCTSCWNVCNRRTNKSKQPQRQQLPLHSRSLEHHSSSSSSNTSSSNTTKQSIRVLPQLFLLVLFAVVMTNISLLCLQQFHIYNYYLNPDDLQAFSYRLERDLQFQLASQEAALVVKYQVQHEQAQEQQKQQKQRHLSLFSSSTNSLCPSERIYFCNLARIDHSQFHSIGGCQSNGSRAVLETYPPSPLYQQKNFNFGRTSPRMFSVGLDVFGQFQCILIIASFPTRSIRVCAIAIGRIQSWILEE
jgi:flagellar basal body-associated protein FliL